MERWTIPSGIWYFLQEFLSNKHHLMCDLLSSEHLWDLEVCGISTTKIKSLRYRKQEKTNKCAIYNLIDFKNGVCRYQMLIRASTIFSMVLKWGQRNKSRQTNQIQIPSLTHRSSVLVRTAILRPRVYKMPAKQKTWKCQGHFGPFVDLQNWIKIWT